MGSSVERDGATVSLTFNHAASIIDITSPQTTLACQDLIDAIREEEASERGIIFSQIATASGKEALGNNVYVGLTVNLLNVWQVRFWSGNYIAKIAGGNLVGGPGNDPVAYSAGVQVLLIQSAASTVVVGSGGDSGLTADLVWSHAAAQTIRKLLQNKTVTDPETGIMTVYDDDNTTELFTALLKEDVTGTQPYRGKGANVRERLD